MSPEKVQQNRTLWPGVRGTCVPDSCIAKHGTWKEKNNRVVKKTTTGSVTERRFPVDPNNAVPTCWWNYSIFCCQLRFSACSSLNLHSTSLGKLFQKSCTCCHRVSNMQFLQDRCTIKSKTGRQLLVSGDTQCQGLGYSYLWWFEMDGVQVGIGRWERRSLENWVLRCITIWLCEHGKQNRWVVKCLFQTHMKSQKRHCNYILLSNTLLMRTSI